MKQVLIITYILLNLIGCATARPAPEAPPSAPKSNIEDEERVDIDGLRKSLRLNQEPEDLGYYEKPFSSCRVGYGFSPTNNCRSLYLAVINFRLQCRDSEGTVSEMVTNAELTNLTSRIRWKLGANEGITSTDGEGFGQIVTVLSRTGKSQRLKLTHRDDFLMIPASESRRLIIPRDWCE